MLIRVRLLSFEFNYLQHTLLTDFKFSCDTCVHVLSLYLLIKGLLVVLLSLNMCLSVSVSQMELLCS